MDILSVNTEARDRLADLLEAAQGGMSQREFAGVLGVSLGALQGWLECRTIPSTASLDKIAACVGQSLPELLDYLEDGGGSPPSDLDSVILRIHHMDLIGLSKVAIAVGHRLAEIGAS